MREGFLSVEMRGRPSNRHWLNEEPMMSSSTCVVLQVSAEDLSLLKHDWFLQHYLQPLHSELLSLKALEDHREIVHVPFCCLLNTQNDYMSILLLLISVLGIKRYSNLFQAALSGVVFNVRNPFLSFSGQTSPCQEAFQNCLL